jgi:hypothetical protein
MDEDLDLKKRAIEALAVVSSVRFHAGGKTHKAGYHANLRCGCKKHDCWSSQAFASHRLEFYDIFHTKGLDEVLKFAWNDEAETARKEAALMAENSRCVAAAAGTGASGASIEGQAAAAVITVLRDARAPGDEQPRRKRCDVSEEEFERRHDQVQDEKFWAWQQGTDNATHFKSRVTFVFTMVPRPSHGPFP